MITNTMTLLAPLTGIGNYVHTMSSQIKKLRPEFDCSYFYGYYSKKLKLENQDNALYSSSTNFIRKMPAVASFARAARDSLARLQLRKYDLYFEPNHIPLNIRAKKIVTTIHDFSLVLHPNWHPKDRADYFARNFLKKIHKSNVIITLSDFIRNKTLELLKDYRGEIVTIPLGYDKELFNTRNESKTDIDLPEKFILFVGSIEPRKNLKRLLQAYMQLPENVKKDYKLLIAGFQGWKNKDIMDLSRKADGQVEYLGYVSNENLAALYRKASCFVYPSLYEGFGLPPLEAMASGCAVVVSNVASLPEVCGNAVCYVDPASVDSIAGGLYDVLTNESLRNDYMAKGLERAELFSWEKTAIEHLKVFEKVYNRKD